MTEQIWIRPNGNIVTRHEPGAGWAFAEQKRGFGENHNELPADAVELVPASGYKWYSDELSQARQTIAERDESLFKATLSIDLGRRLGEWGVNTIAEYIETTAAMLGVPKGRNEYQAVMEMDTVPLPAVQSPEALRFAADVIEATAVPVPFGGDGPNQERTATQLRAEAERVEIRAAEDAKRAAELDELANEIGFGWSNTHVTETGAYKVARRLVAAGWRKQDQAGAPSTGRSEGKQ